MWDSVLNSDLSGSPWPFSLHILLSHSSWPSVSSQCFSYSQQPDMWRSTPAHTRSNTQLCWDHIYFRLCSWKRKQTDGPTHSCDSTPSHFHTGHSVTVFDGKKMRKKIFLSHSLPVKTILSLSNSYLFYWRRKALLLQSALRRRRRRRRNLSTHLSGA